MSNLEVGFTQQEMEANGEMDFIRQHVAAANAAAAGEAPTPAPEADTVEETTQVEEQVDEPVEEDADSADEEVPADGGTEEDAELTPEEEDVLYLELDDDTQNLIDSKYGGDVGKALAALRESQSLIGRQGSELGDLRKQLEDLTALVQRGQVMQQPYPEWPDEFSEPHEAAAAFRAIADEAFNREDLDTFSSAVDAWIAQDPAGAGTYRDLKILQLQTAVAQQAPVVPDAEVTLKEGAESVKQEFPQFGKQDPAFMAAFDAELEKFPTLRALLWGEIPGTTPDQRIAALRETVGRVASQFTAETERAARRRVAIRTNEEARQARREARVTSGATARVVEPEQAPRTVPMGTTGRSLDNDRLNAMLPPEDRICVGPGAFPDTPSVRAARRTERQQYTPSQEDNHHGSFNRHRHRRYRGAALQRARRGHGSEDRPQGDRQRPVHDHPEESPLRRRHPGRGSVAGRPAVPEPHDPRHVGQLGQLRHDLRVRGGDRHGSLLPRWRHPVRRVDGREGGGRLDLHRQRQRQPEHRLDPRSVGAVGQLRRRDRDRR
jgi:hypothetical protein